MAETFFQGTRLCYIALLALSVYVYFMRRKVQCVNHPPIVDIPPSQIFGEPRLAYETALAKHGHIIAVKRKGRLEYIVDEHLTRQILTDNDVFSFEQGTATILNLYYFYKIFGKLFTKMYDLVHTAILSRMDQIIYEVGPVFSKHANLVIQRSKSTNKPIDVFRYTHKCISEAMAIIILGKEYVNERNLAIIEKFAEDAASLTGIYQNTSFWARTFPSIWRFFNVIYVFVSTLWGFCRVIGPQVWIELRSNRNDDGESSTILQYLARKHEKIGVKSFVSTMCLLLGIIFASVHQTSSVAVWVVFKLAVHQEYLQAIREEISTLTEVDPSTGQPVITYAALCGARHLDSFIREVMRTKGDTLSTCRVATKDVEIGGFTLLRGSLILPMATLSHMNKKYHGADAEIFDGDRWCRDEVKQAITMSASYFPFGLGRWACPGRVLAVSEIKMIVWSLLYRNTPCLRGNEYKVVDPLNITSVPPQGEMVLGPL